MRWGSTPHYDALVRTLNITMLTWETWNNKILAP